MKRGYLHCAAVISAGIVCQIGLLRADDRVEYRDSKNRATIVIANGTITDENFATVKVKLAAGGKEVVIPVADLVKTTYDLPGEAKINYNPVATLEANQDYVKALDGYKNLLGKTAGSEKAKRFFEYKIATISAAIASEKPDQSQAAIDALKKFVSTQTTTYLTANAARQLIALQLKANDSTGALATVDSWAKIANLPKESKLEADLARVDVLLQSNKGKEAQAKAEELAKGLAASDPIKARLELYTFAGSAADPAAKMPDVAKKFDDAIAKSSDNNFKSLAYLILGDCYRAKGQLRDAMWSYLWVDVVFNQDRSEHIKALDRLVQLFESEGMKDAERAKMYRDKLAKIRQ